MADAPETTACIGNDPFCPCQDGDACHYVDLPGSPAMKPKPAPLSIEMRDAMRKAAMPANPAFDKIHRAARGLK